MTRRYFDDLRARVAASVVAGQTCRAAAALFDVSVSAAAEWSARLRAESSAGAKPMAVLAGKRDWLLKRIAAVPDLTLRAIRAELASRGIVVSLCVSQRWISTPTSAATHLTRTFSLGSVSALITTRGVGNRLLP